MENNRSRLPIPAREFEAIVVIACVILAAAVVLPFFLAWWLSNG